MTSKIRVRSLRVSTKIAALVSDRVYVPAKGHICRHGAMAAVMDDDDLQRVFLTM